MSFNCGIFIAAGMCKCNCDYVTVLFFTNRRDRGRWEGRKKIIARCVFDNLEFDSESMCSKLDTLKSKILIKFAPISTERNLISTA